MPNLFTLLGKAARKPPHVVAHRLIGETRRLVDRYALRPDGSWPSRRQLLSDLKASSLGGLWKDLAKRPYVTAPIDPDAMRAACPAKEREAILAAAERAVNHEVNLLGSGTVSLGEHIVWNRDYKTGHSWPNAFAGDIEYSNLDQPSDVKFPWELSRLQWLMPAGQAYVLTGDELYAEAAKQIIVDWIEANPYAWSVNWSCTMEAAMRIFSWTWFFHVFHAAKSWREEAFRVRFLSALYAHGRFTEQYLEFSDVNGNHCTADAAAMVCAGLFFGGSEKNGPRHPRRWQRTGWRLLERELPQQVTRDGVDFEGSVPYHRLCTELFFLPALYRQQCGLTISSAYRERVVAMGHFIQAYTKPNGFAPLIGDADDARTLPLGQQGINDHRYLSTMIGAAWDVAELVDDKQRRTGENLWMLGAQRHSSPETTTFSGARGLKFPNGGYYVLRNEADHVFIDAAPIGQGGRGGHGHNDCLSFEAVLNGVPLITDCGAYIYTGSFTKRNQFRSTHAHNTPIIDGEEINRFHGPKMLWTMHNDARPQVRQCVLDASISEVEASHSGYHRLADPVTPVRHFRLDHSRHELTISDAFETAANASHSVQIALHFDPEVNLTQVDEREWHLKSGGKAFGLRWSANADWSVAPEECRVSPSYGVAVKSNRLVWRFEGSLGGVYLKTMISPA